MALISNITPTLSQLTGLGALLLVYAGLYAIGSVVTGRNRIPEASVVYGWGLAILAFTLTGAAGLLNFTPIAVFIGLCAVAGIIYVIRQDSLSIVSPIVRILTLALPLLLIAAAMIPTQWDDLSQWLPNARFLFEHNSFPRADLPPSPSYFPSYPYGLPIVTYLASKITGTLVESAGAIFNIMLYLGFGLFVVRIARSFTDASGDTSEIRDQSFNNLGWGLCALAALTVTFLNPTWVTRLVFSSYSDLGTTIAAGFTVGLTWLALNAKSAQQTNGANSFALQAGLAACVLIGLRQSNLVLLLILFIGASYVIWRDPALRLKESGSLALRLMTLPIIVWLAWRWQVETQIGGGEFSFRPLSEWFLPESGDVLGKMLSVATKKGGYFGIMLVAALMALRVFWSPRTGFQRLLLLSAFLFAGYNAFLLIAYLGAFNKTDALRAASYWRYNTHLGGVCILVAVATLVIGWRKWGPLRATPKWVTAILVVIVVAAPVLMSKKLRFDGHPRYGFSRLVADDLRQMLSPDHRLVLIDQNSDGQYLVIMRYALHGSAPLIGEYTSWQNHSADKIRELVKLRNATHVWSYDNAPQVSQAFGLNLPRNAASLLVKSGDGWRLMKQWPHSQKRQ